jgi:hypothetical protein
MSDYYILKNGEPAKADNVLAWGRWFEGADEERRVAADEIGDVRVSTVFLGLDHGYGEGPPVLYETMIFGGEHDDYQERYSTRAEAEAGHARAVTLVKQSAWSKVPDA